jgi:hypothetical protein
MAITVTIDTRALVSANEAYAFLSANSEETFDDVQKDQIIREINYVSRRFESVTKRFIIKKNITEFWDGGRCKENTLFAPVWANADSSKVLLGQDEYDVEVGDIEFKITDTSDDTVFDSDNYSIDNDTGLVRFDSLLCFGKRRWKTQYTTGYYVDTSTVDSQWKEQALAAISWRYANYQAMFTSDGDSPTGVRELPFDVKLWLESQVDLRF